MSFRRISILVFTSALVVVPGALASGLPKVPSYAGTPSNSNFKVKPASIQIAGDASFYYSGRKESHNRAGALKWTSWTATGGRSSGFNWVNNCKPDCASGKFHQYPVKLRVWRPRHLGGYLLFTRMTVTYTNGRPSSVPHKTEVLKVSYKKDYVFWTPPYGG